MAYDERYENGNSMRQKDFVLATNEFCFLQNKTNGQIKTYSGPIMLTISQQESLVVFDPKTKQFREVRYCAVFVKGCYLKQFYNV